MKVLDRFLDLRSRWLTLIGEHLQTAQGDILEYWRVEKDHSVVILPILNGQLLLPPPVYRPGIGTETWDFPGGRVPANRTPESVVPAILQRELGIEEGAIAHLTSLNAMGWAVNSSFSNQHLFGFVADLHPDTALNPQFVGSTFPATPEGMAMLLKDLTCLQCRAIALEWWIMQLPGFTTN